jgi:hypothetical protein
MATAIDAAVDKFRSGDKESAFFELIELPGDVLPVIIDVFRGESRPDVRAS